MTKTKSGYEPELVKRILDLRTQIKHNNNNMAVIAYRHKLRCLLEDNIDTILASLQPSEMVMVPKSAIAWLMGEGPDADGHWFGDGPDVAERHKAAFWWRTKFRAMIAASPSSNSTEG